jgi:leader peptidase (prepilin peptidase)/N-methyltransferase
MQPVLVLFIAAVVGYLWGTVLAVLLDRAYSGAPLRGPLAPCAHCGGPRFWWTGTIGYLWARGTCACRRRLPAPLWYLPLAGATAAVLIALHAEDARHAVLVALFASVLLVLAGTDFERHLLPNRLMYPALAAALLLSWAWPGRSLTSTLAGGAVGFLAMLLLFVLSPSLGFGDVKLGALLGLLTGLPAALEALALAIIAGGLAAAFMLITRRAGRASTIAYGPYLALGAFLVMLLQ